MTRRCLIYLHSISLVAQVSATKEMMQPSMARLHSISLVAPERNQRDDATLSNLPTGNLFGCAGVGLKR